AVSGPVPVLLIVMLPDALAFGAAFKFNVFGATEICPAPGVAVAVAVAVAVGVPPVAVAVGVAVFVAVGVGVGNDVGQVCPAGLSTVRNALVLPCADALF